MSNISAQTDTTAPLHQPFSWRAERFGRNHCMQSMSKDIGFGIATILEILEMDLLNRADGIRPVLGVIDSGILLRMAITSAKLLAETASEEMDRENDCDTKGTGHE